MMTANATQGRTVRAVFGFTVVEVPVQIAGEWAFEYEVRYGRDTIATFGTEREAVSHATQVHDEMEQGDDIPGTIESAEQDAAFVDAMFRGPEEQDFDGNPYHGTDHSEDNCGE